MDAMTHDGTTKNYRALFKSDISFNITNILQNSKNNLTKVNNLLTSKIKENNEKLLNFYQENQDLFKNESDKIVSGTTVKSLGANIINGITGLTSFVDIKYLKEFNNQTYISKAYVFFKMYTDLNVNTITLLSFSTNVQSFIKECFDEFINSQTNNNQANNNQ